MNKYFCIKTVKMSSSGKIEFTKGKLYDAKLESVFINNSGNPHGVGQGKWKKKHFIKLIKS